MIARNTYETFKLEDGEGTARVRIFETRVAKSITTTNLFSIRDCRLELKLHDER
jgi:hypothetical protein